MNRYLTLIILLFFSATGIFGQNVSNKKTAVMHQEYVDSLKKTPYEWRLPILGSQVRRKGFDIPYPNGIMINYVMANQDVTLENLAVGLSPDELTDVSSIARFESISPHINVINLRYDFWLLPFLNLYALGGYVDSKSDIKLALPFAAEFTSNGKGPSVGWGVAVAGGLGPLFVSSNYNMVWTYLPQLESPALAKVFDIRLGHTFQFRKYPQSNLSIMLGAQYQKLSPESKGQVDLSTLTGMTPEKKEEALGQLDDWYYDLPESQQDRLSDFHGAMSGWLSNEEGTILHYSFNKKLYYPWSATAGLNYQINKRYILMVMYTFLGSRDQLVVSLNYRFGFKGKNVLAGTTL